jgi:glycerol-3-phosphate dehydrogenase
MSKIATADVIVFGGGVAGLWLLHRLRKMGFSAILFESSALGGGQTAKSQGIIHGGMKYTLQGSATKEAQALADMPTLWRECLAGRGVVDLSSVQILSAQHYLFAPNKLTAKLAGFFAGATLTSKVTPLARDVYPPVLQDAAFKGEVFALDEIVIDVPSLIRALVKANQNAIYHIEPLSAEELTFSSAGKLLSARVYSSGEPIEVSAQHFVFTAGAGNEIILRKLSLPALSMQRRPLHMVLVKTPFDIPLYAHCLGLGTKPRIKITTH